MVKVSSVTEPYFSHDYSTREKKEIKKLILDMGFEGYGLYWAIVEFMYRNELMIGEEALVIDKSYEEKIKSILNNYKLFHIDENCYISDRIIKTIEKQEEKSKNSKQAIETRWLISDFCSSYKAVMGDEPVLSDSDICSLKKYAKKIDDLRTKLPDILYTLKTLRFENNPKFIPTINWLLESNNLVKLLNGGYGELKSWKKHKEYLQAKEKERLAEELIKQQEAENVFDIETVTSKAEAIELLVKNAVYIKAQNQCKINPVFSQLLKKFDIALSEIKRIKIERMSQNAKI